MTTLGETVVTELPSTLAPGHASLSIVVPVYNEQDSLAELCDRILAVMQDEGYKQFEILFVDDGSRDQSWSIIQQLHKMRPDFIHALRHRRNFGKAAALAQGFAAATGDIIVTMDADLQDQPEEIPKLIQPIFDGSDMVSGWKQKRHDPLDKTLPSKVFNFLARAASGLKLHDFNCGFKAYRAEAAKSVHLYGELHRFIPMLAHANGYTVAEVAVEHHARTHGKSKYGAERLVKGLLDLMTVFILTRYFQRPGHFFGGLGLLSGFMGFCILAWLSVQKLVAGASLGTRPLFFLGILLLLLGVQLFSIGVVGEMLVRLSVKNSRAADITDSVGIQPASLLGTIHLQDS